MDIPLNIDWTAIVGLLAIAQALLLCLYLTAFHGKRAEVWILSGLILSITIALGHDVLLHSRLALYLPHIIGFGPFSTYLVGPLILCIVVKLIWPDYRFKWYDALHLLPFTIHFISRLPKYFGSPDDKLNFLEAFYQKGEPISQQIPFSLDALMGIVTFYGHRFIYIGVALYLLIKFKSAFTHALSARARFYRLILTGLVAYCSGWLVLRIVKFFTGGVPDLIINASALAVVVIATALVIFHYAFDDIFSNKSTQKYKQNPMDEGLTRQIVEQLDVLLGKEQLFSDNELKLSTLSQHSGFSTQQISQALNSQGVTFNDFLNRYRLAHIKAQLQKPENAKADIQQLALDSGFNSKATFYRVFKEKVGMTPSEYRKTNQQG